MNCDAHFVSLRGRDLVLKFILGVIVTFTKRNNVLTYFEMLYVAVMYN